MYHLKKSNQGIMSDTFTHEINYIKLCASVFSQGNNIIFLYKEEKLISIYWNGVEYIANPNKEK